MWKRSSDEEVRLSEEERKESRSAAKVQEKVPASSPLLLQPKPEEMQEAIHLMQSFAQRTGLVREGESASAQMVKQQEPPRRYLWTDAFAVGNFLFLAQLAPNAEEASKWRDLAHQTMTHVHTVLGQHRPDDPQGRTGWLSGTGGTASEEHPTRAGLRIGKKKPEPSKGEGDAAWAEWERDGQYCHYLTKWESALDQLACALQRPRLNLWARELADATHRIFTYSTSARRVRMVWKADVSGSKPVVRSQGQHDALDCLITGHQLMLHAQTLHRHSLDPSAPIEGPTLKDALSDWQSIVDGMSVMDMATSDTLGLGSILIDAARVEQINRQRGQPLTAGGSDLLEQLLTAALYSLRTFERHFEADEPATSRLAFREMGLAIGLAGVQRMNVELQSGQFSGTAASRTLVQQLQRFVPLGKRLTSFWLQTPNQRVRTWREHEDINAVMLATALIPEAMLNVTVAGTAAVPVSSVKPTPSSTSVQQAPPRVLEAARCQPPVSMTDLRSIRQAAQPIDLTSVVEAAARLATAPLTDEAMRLEHRPAWLTTLMNAIGNARVVMIGEATHGTEEFYRMRAFVTQHLLQHAGFDFVCVEGDYPDLYRPHRYAQGAGTDPSAEKAMQELQRFPQWMWRNHATRDFIEWMRRFNMQQREQLQQQQSDSAAAARGMPTPPLKGFYGLDLYSLYSSSEAVIQYLHGVSPTYARKARRYYSKLASFKDEAHEYGLSVACGLVESQQAAVVQVLTDLVRSSHQLLAQDGLVAGEELLQAKFNALVVRDAEQYYRAAITGGHQSWNIRDEHMVRTLFTLLQVYSDRKLEALGQAHPQASAERAMAISDKEIVAQILSTSASSGAMSKAVVWAHNSHLGDARATQRQDRHEWNVGQLVRERLGLKESFNLGFTTYTGTVSAAGRWGGLRETMSINPGLPESYEQLMHEVSMRTEQTPLPNFQLIMRSNADGPSTSTAPMQQSGALSVLRNPERLERAIGVQYVKRTERWSHYFRALLPSQFDALMHFDTTQALQPLIAQPEVEWREEQKAMDAGAKPVPSEDESEEEEEMMG